MERWSKTEKSLAYFFERIGGDTKVCEPTRILRLPYSINRKAKYGELGKLVSLVEHNDVRYDFETLSDTILFFENGGFEALHERVLDGMQIEVFGEREEVRFVPAPEWFEDDFFVGDIEEYRPQRYLVTPPRREERKPINKKPAKDLQYEEEHTENAKADIKPHIHIVPSRVVDEINKHFKGIRVNYEHLKTVEKDWQNRDMLFYILNRNGYVVGLRNYLIFLFAYNYFNFWHVREYEDMLLKIRKLNSYFQPAHDEAELQKETMNVLEYLKRNCRPKRIRNVVIMRMLQFHEDEIHIMQGAYAYDEEEKAKVRKDKSSLCRRKRYDKYLLENGKERRSEQTKKKIEYFKALFEKEPLMTYKKFEQITGLSQWYYDYYRHVLGFSANNQKRHEILEKEYFDIFDAKPDIRYMEFNEIKPCSRDTFRRWRNRYMDSRKN